MICFLKNDTNNNTPCKLDIPTYHGFIQVRAVTGLHGGVTEQEDDPLQKEKVCHVRKVTMI